jgi:hypothetical protein
MSVLGWPAEWQRPDLLLQLSKSENNCLRPSQHFLAHVKIFVKEFRTDTDTSTFNLSGWSQSEFDLKTWRLQNGYQPRTNLVADENGDLLADTYSILKMWKNYFCQPTMLGTLKYIQLSHCNLSLIFWACDCYWEVEPLRWRPYVPLNRWEPPIRLNNVTA